MSRWIDETLHPDFRLTLKADRVLYEERTAHQHLVLFDNDAFGRVMMLDGVIQCTERDEFIYHEMMAHVPLFAHERPRKVLIIGGGDGGILREALKHEGVEVTLCEIDETVIELTKRYMPFIPRGAFDHPRARIVITDGVKFVAETNDRFDIICIDSSDPIGPSAVLFTKSFYADCKRTLAPGGILVTQNGMPLVQASELRDSARFFRQIGFRDVHAYLLANATYSGGPMALGWATDDASLRRTPVEILRTRFKAAGFKTEYYTPEVHDSAFALPPYVERLIEAV